MKNFVKCFVIITIIMVMTFFPVGKVHAIDLKQAALNGDSVAKAFAVVEKNSGRLIMAKNENERLPMASTTKIVTAIAVIENNDLTKTVTVPKAAVGVEGSSMYLKEGEKYTVKDLLCGLMLRSGNDCAVALALDTSGGIEEFAKLMNGIASKLKLTNSHFVNPHGLPENNHYTSAYDLAIITAYALKNKEFSEIVKSKNYMLSNGNTIINKNKLLSSLEGCDGVKTGFTKEAGRCLVSSATRGDATYICVVLSCGPMFEECAEKLNTAFNSLIMTDIISINTPLCEIEVVGGEQKHVSLGLACVTHFPFTPDEAMSLRFEFELPPCVLAPLQKGEKIGKLHIYYNNRLLFSEDLFTMESIDLDYDD